MRVAMKALPIFACSIALSCSAFAAPTSNMGAAIEIQKSYQRSNAAFGRKDAAGVMANLAPGYRQSFKGRTLDRAGVERQMKMMFANSRSVNTQTTITKLVLGSGKATATVRESLKVVGVNPQTKKLMTLASSGITEDTWVLTRGKWLVQQSKGLSVKATLDGKPLRL
jgi:hypothetical protein